MIYQVKALDYSVGQVSADRGVSHSTVKGVAITGWLSAWHPVKVYANCGSITELIVTCTVHVLAVAAH